MLYAAVKAGNCISHSLSVEQKEEEELRKISTGIGKVFLQNVREREKLRQWKLAHLDPRNASRTPSAAREPAYRLRYESPVNACKLNNDLARFHTCS
jgi:actin-binding LIM protein